MRSMATFTESLQSGGVDVWTLVSLLVAALFGALLGLERETEGKAAGLRTHLLVGLGAALATQLSMRATSFGALEFADPGRIAAQIVSGIGFIGAGVIIQSGGSVRGLTTAATLWVTAMIGMAAGMEAYVQAALVTGVALVALRGLGRLEHYFDRQVRWYLVEVVWAGRPERVEELLARVDRDAVPEFSLEGAFVREDETGCRLRFRTRRDRLPGIVLAVGRVPDVREVRTV